MIMTDIKAAENKQGYEGTDGLCPAGGALMIHRILTAIDGSTHAAHAIDFAADLAARYDAELILLHVTPHSSSAQVPTELLELAKIEHVEPSESEILKGVAETMLDQAEKHARAAGAKRIRTKCDMGHAAELIVAHAKEEKADLIVMGRRGLGAIGGLLLGSVSHKVSQLSECACLTVT